ncbi:MAG: ParB/RepB/Spo0J family partition protein, partial [Cyanobacteria bacterium J06636_16]
QLNDLKVTPMDAAGGVQYYPLEAFVPLRLPDGIGQPRRYFDPAGMEKLKVSIAKVGIQEPLLVRRAQDGKLEIVSGERRWRCGADLKLEVLPAIEKALTDEEALEIALVANLMRENLNIVEETDSIVSLLSLRLRIGREKLPSLLMKIRNLRLRYEKDDAGIVETLQVDEDPDHSGMIRAESIALMDGILAEFSLILDSLVNRLIAIKKMPEIILDAVREGKIDFSKADIIRRSNLSPEVQSALLSKAENGLPKSSLMERVKELKQAHSEVDDTAGDLSKRFRQSAQKLYSHKSWKRIQANSKLKKKFQRLQVLADELLVALEDAE